MSVVAFIAAFVAFIIAGGLYQALRRAKRAEFIRTYSFPHGLLARLAEKHPALSLKQQQLVMRGLRKFFLCNLMANGQFVSMPSKVVDDLWHEFILFTKHYDEFCKQAFGKFLHHTPAVVLGSQAIANQGLRRTWVYACRDETISPLTPTRLPLLFALDSKLDIAGGYRYVPNCDGLRDKPGDAGVSSLNCATDFGRRRGDGGEISSEGDFSDLGFSSDGGSDGGGCGGGGD